MHLYSCEMRFMNLKSMKQFEITALYKQQTSKYLTSSLCSSVQKCMQMKFTFPSSFLWIPKHIVFPESTKLSHIPMLFLSVLLLSRISLPPLVKWESSQLHQSSNTTFMKPAETTTFLIYLPMQFFSPSLFPISPGIYL